MFQIEGKIINAGYYTDCLPVAVITIDKKFSEAIKAENDKRVSALLKVGEDIYNAGIRTTEKMKYVKICPDLLTINGSPARLVDALNKIGLKVKDSIKISIINNTIEISEA